MKKRLVPLAMLMSAMSMNAAVNIERIEPTNWYVGMKDASLQLMVCGKEMLLMNWPKYNSAAFWAAT